MDIPAADFTNNARQVIDLAYQQAVRRQSERVEPGHLLLGILGVKGNRALQTLSALKVDLDQLVGMLESRLPAGTGYPLGVEAAPRWEGEGKDALHYAIKEARHLGHHQVDTLHLLLGLLYEGRGVACDALEHFDVSLYELRQHVLNNPALTRTMRAPRASRVPLPSLTFLGLLSVFVVSGVLLWLNPAESLIGALMLVFIVCGWIVSVCVHEFGHALAAFLGGDLSVKDKGYLTLDPIRYTDPLFSIIMPVIFLLLGGFGLPGGAVYINTSALRSRWWQTIVSAAGPLGTIVFCALIVWPFFLDWRDWVTESNQYFWAALTYLALLQITAVIFNLIPIPPLDGFGIASPWLPNDLRNQMMMFGNLLFFVLLFVMWNDNPFTQAFWTQVYDIASFLRLPFDMLLLAGEHLFFLQ
ncbi:MAG TPA: Clp protease N-terminal domain-containing protein [Herpetosiphonaceae bacterium]